MPVQNTIPTLDSQLQAAVTYVNEAAEWLNQEGSFLENAGTAVEQIYLGTQGGVVDSSSIALLYPNGWPSANTPPTTGRLGVDAVRAKLLAKRLADSVAALQAATNQFFSLRTNNGLLTNSNAKLTLANQILQQKLDAANQQIATVPTTTTGGGSSGGGSGGGANDGSGDTTGGLTLPPAHESGMSTGAVVASVAAIVGLGGLAWFLHSRRVQQGR